MKSKSKPPRNIELFSPSLAKRHAAQRSGNFGGTRKEGETQSLGQAVSGADVFVGIFT